MLISPTQLPQAKYDARSIFKECEAPAYTLVGCIRWYTDQIGCVLCGGSRSRLPDAGTEDDQHLRFAAAAGILKCQMAIS